MKHLNFLCALCLFLNSTQTLALPYYDRSNEQQSLYGYYFMIKELCKASVMYTFFVDEKKIEKAKIACCQCNYVVTGSSLWAYAVVYTKESLLLQLMPLIYKESTQEINVLLLQTFQEEQISCDNCQAYHGWNFIALS